MAKMIQLRNVPDKLHRKLKARTAKEGMSLSDYLMSAIRHVAERPTLNELRVRLHQRVPVELDGAVAKVVRAQRESR